MKRARIVVLPYFVLVSLLVPIPVEGGPPMSSEVTVTALDMHEYKPDVAYNSTRDEYFVVYHDFNGTAWAVMGARITAAGDYIDYYVIAYEHDPVRDNGEPSVAYDPVNDRYLVVWSRDFFGDSSDMDIFARLVPWDGPDGSLTAFSVDGALGRQWTPRVAYGGTDQKFMVTWWSEAVPGTAASVWARLVSASGTPEATSINVTSDPTEGRLYPDIAYNRARNEHIIVYQKMEAGGGDIHGVRLTGSGAVLGGGSFAIAGWPDAETAPRIAASRVSSAWAVAWHSQVDPSYKDVYARTVAVDGSGAIQLGPPVHPGATGLNDSYPDVGAHTESSNFLITWQAQYSNLSGEYGIDARVLNANGTLGALFEPRQLLGGETTDCEVPAVAGGVDDWMVVWQHGRDGWPSYEDIHGRILFADILVDGFESNDTTEWSATVP